MKKEVKFLNGISISFMGLLFISPSCSSFEPCDALYSADLLVEAIVPNFQNEGSDGDLYELVHTSLNSIEGIVCRRSVDCENIEIADSHDYTQNIYYSESATSEWGEPIDQYDFSNDPLSACSKAENTDIIKFLVDGYYLIEGIVDSHNSVSERDENNNDLTAGLDGQTSRSSAKNLIIHVDRGFKPEQVSRNGKIKYIERIGCKTIYFNN